jgi:hypothetical protein
LPVAAVQRLLRPRMPAGSTRHSSIDLVSAPAPSKQTVWFLRTPIDATKVHLWSPGEPNLARGLRVVNRTSWTLPTAPVEITLDATLAGAATLETLEPGETTMLAYATGDRAPITRNVAERVHSARIIAVSLGFTIVEKQLVRATTFANEGRDLIFTFHKKGPTRIAAQLPAGTVDIGDAWWIPIAPGTFVLEEREIRRHRVRLLDALPKETEPYLDDPTLPADVAKALRDVMALRASLLAVPSRSVQHYELRAKLRALLATIRFGS